MSIITTFENQCRALTSAPSSDENVSRFLVGTLSPSSENLIYLLEYRDDINNLAKVTFKFPYGECWHLSTSSKYPLLLAGVTSQKGKSKVSLFKLPNELENLVEDDYVLSELPIERVFDLVTEENCLTKQCHWHPDDGDKLLTYNNGRMQFWDVNEGRESSSFSISNALGRSETAELGLKPPKVTDLRWSSLFSCSVVAVAVDQMIYGVDTRIPDTSSSSICWLIEDSHCSQVRSVDFNPNSQFYVATGGDDSVAKFWDLRQTSHPSLHLQAHTHWIWSVRYNPFHDQLVLSAGSDARVALMRVQSIASEPFGRELDCDYEEDTPVVSTGNDSHLEADDEDQSSDDLKEVPPLTEKCGDLRRLGDELINLYEEHDDSVYVAEWSTDPWIFASLGYESRLVINRVPKEEKFNILF